MKNDDIKRIGRFGIRLEFDADPESPRELDNLGTMVCWHRRYNLGDKHEFATPADFEAWWKENGKGGVRLPLYLYDHSGLTMSTSPFSCQWDSGQVGYIYVTKDRIVKEYGKNSKKKATLCLTGEVETYDTFLTGEVYGYVLSEYEHCGEDAECVDDHVESCWGVYGREYAEKEAIANLEAHVKYSDEIPTLKAIGVA